MSWEYKVEWFSPRHDGKFEDCLNKFGKDGWELVQYTPSSSNQGVTVTFKRPA
jgi:hypothetical protein